LRGRKENFRTEATIKEKMRKSCGEDGGVAHMIKSLRGGKRSKVPFVGGKQKKGGETGV